MRKEIIYLVAKYFEEQIVGLAIANDIFKLKPGKNTYRFKNMDMTEKGFLLLNEIKEGKEQIPRSPDPKNVKTYRYIWPTGHRGTPKNVTEKMTRYLTEHPDVTEEQIIDAARRFVASKTHPYYGYAQYFLYKKEPGKPAVSRIDEWLEEDEQQDSLMDSTEIDGEWQE